MSNELESDKAIRPMPGQDQTLCSEPCDGEARRTTLGDKTRHGDDRNDLISTVIHLCIEPCDGEARRTTLGDKTRHGE